MALLESKPPQTGSKMPDFALNDVDGKNHTSGDFQGKNGLVVMFLCGHCPYVLAVEDRLTELARQFQPEGIAFVAICSNDPEQNDADKPEAIKQWAENKQHPFPWLIDDTQEVARKFDAVCTPDIFVYDSNFQLFYHGRIDDRPKDASAAKKHDLQTALSNLLKGSQPPADQIPSMGCSIKWKDQ